MDIPHDIFIPEGLFGFEDYTKWTLEDSGYEPFLLLKSCDKKALLEFLLVDPFLVCKDYEIDVDDSNLEKIGIKAPSDIFVLTIITMGQTGTTATTNLSGPVVINRKTGVAMQTVITDTRWTTKYDIIKALSAQEAV